jgi:hypothetical protein
MHDHQRPGHRPVESHRLEFGALLIDDDLLLFDLHPEFDDLRSLLGRLLVGMHERRRDQLDLLARQIEILRKCGRCEDEGGERRTHHCGSAGQHGHFPSVQLNACRLRSRQGSSLR